MGIVSLCACEEHVTHIHMLVKINIITVNTCQSAAIPFWGIRWIDEFGIFTGYPLALVHYIGTGKLWWIERFGG